MKNKGKVLCFGEPLLRMDAKTLYLTSDGFNTMNVHVRGSEVNVCVGLMGIHYESMLNYKNCIYTSLKFALAGD